MLVCVRIEIIVHTKCDKLAKYSPIRFWLHSFWPANFAHIFQTDNIVGRFLPFLNFNLIPSLGDGEGEWNVCDVSHGDLRWDALWNNRHLTFGYCYWLISRIAEAKCAPDMGDIECWVAANPQSLLSSPSRAPLPSSPPTTAIMTTTSPNPMQTWYARRVLDRIALFGMSSLVFLVLLLFSFLFIHAYVTFCVSVLVG